MSSDSMRAVKDCVSGTVGGFLQVFVGQVKQELGDLLFARTRELISITS